MNARRQSLVGLRALAMLCLLLLATTGCQTFNLSEERFAQQQQGRYSNSPEGTGVEVFGCLMQFFGPWLACQ